jgi:hypothetical protein
MDSSAKRKVGAIALIVAGIGAFLVPFLLHGPALQASSNGGGNTNSNNNNGNSCTTNCSPASTCTTNCSTDTNPTTCTSDDSTDPSGHTHEGLHLAKGHDKQDTSIVGKAHGFMAAMAKHNPQHDATHSTKTDNDTVKDHTHHSNGHDTDNASACTDSKGNGSSDDESNDD